MDVDTLERAEHTRRMNRLVRDEAAAELRALDAWMSGQDITYSTLARYRAGVLLIAAKLSPELHSVAV